MNTTVIWAPLSYAADIIPVGKRRIAQVEVFEDVAVEIPTVSPDDAPVSVRWTGALALSMPVETIDYRSHGGHSWRQARGIDGRPIDLAGFRAELRRLEAEDVQSTMWIDFPWGEKRSATFRLPLLEDRVSRPRPRDAIEAKSWIADRRQSTVDKAILMSREEMLIIGDELWLKAQEPGWIFQMMNRDEISIQPWRPQLLNPATQSQEIRFRADHLDQAVAHIERCGKSAVCPRAAEIEVVRPDLLTFDERYYACRRFNDLLSQHGARRAIQESHGPGLESLEAFGGLLASASSSTERSNEALALVRIMRDSHFEHVRDQALIEAVDEILEIDRSLHPTLADDDALALSLR